jgi:hypothetical protein
MRLRPVASFVEKPLCLSVSAWTLRSARGRSGCRFAGSTRLHMQRLHDCIAAFRERQSCTNCGIGVSVPDIRFRGANRVIGTHRLRRRRSPCPRSRQLTLCRHSRREGPANRAVSGPCRAWHQQDRCAMPKCRQDLSPDKAWMRDSANCPDAACSSGSNACSPSVRSSITSVLGRCRDSRRVGVTGSQLLQRAAEHHIADAAAGEVRDRVSLHSRMSSRSAKYQRPSPGAPLCIAARHS